jgi:hypothetical protein
VSAKTKKTIVHLWTRLESAPFPVEFSARPTIHRAFSGTAEIFRYTGGHPYIAGAALVRFNAPSPNEAVNLMCSYSGGVSEAVLVAAGLRRIFRLAPIGVHYEDLGGPVGIAEESLRDGSGVFKIVFYRKK